MSTRRKWWENLALGLIIVEALIALAAGAYRAWAHIVRGE